MNYMFELGFPRLSEGQFAVAVAESGTGKVLTVDGERYCGNGDVFKTFDSHDSALDYIEKKLEDSPELECIIFDHKGKGIQTIRGDHRKPIDVDIDDSVRIRIDKVNWLLSLLEKWNKV